MHSIVIIGTDPPCPRCQLLTDIVTIEVNELGLDAEVRHIAFSSDEAAEIAAEVGRTPGTGKTVAHKLGKEIDFDATDIEPEEQQQLEQLDPELQHLRSHFKQVAILNSRLREMEHAAEGAGIMMTPILVIDGVVKHQGSVPQVATIKRWLRELP